MLTRRTLLKGAAAGVPIAMGGVASWPATALAQAGTKTFVLAHGSWHGGWCWKKVADRLRAKGHAVYAPSYTGMGDRAHLLSKDITINTFAEDLVQLIQSEELSNVTYIHCSQPSHPVLEDSRKLVRSWPGWKWVDLAAPHDSMITHPDALVELLLAA